MRRNCNNCLFCDICRCDGLCCDFFPGNPDDEEEFFDEIVETEIEEHRYEYLQAWTLYVDDDRP